MSPHSVPTACKQPSQLTFAANSLQALLRTGERPSPGSAAISTAHSVRRKCSFCPVVYPRKSSFKSMSMSPRKCGMIFLLDMECLWALFAMPVGPACCLQASRNARWSVCHDRKPGALLVCNDRWLRNTAVCKPVPYCSQAATHNPYA